MNDHVVLERVLFTRGVHRIFYDVSFLILRGKIRAIMVPSRTGKTTLLRLIGGQFQCANDS